MVPPKSRLKQRFMCRKFIWERCPEHPCPSAESRIGQWEEPHHGAVTRLRLMAEKLLQWPFIVILVEVKGLLCPCTNQSLDSPTPKGRLTSARQLPSVESHAREEAQLWAICNQLSWKLVDLMPWSQRGILCGMVQQPSLEEYKFLVNLLEGCTS